ncbi:MAG: 2,3-diphosphoglycerate synthetase, partial [Actinomycetota bacterium]|nr:2,3-diphosphoglycerate synthetase [Actinomycetota bacterium]
TGKRTGKTAVTADFARRLAAGGRTPVIVAMGRGGPPDPVVVSAGAAPDLEALLSIAEGGGHAASDFYEDALTSGVATVGARRCGGGLAGAVAFSNVAEAVGAADDLPGDLTLLEGSGAALPPVHADATALIVPGDCDPELLDGYLGRYRILLADLIVVTMCEPPTSSPHQVEAVLEVIRSTSRSLPVLCTVLRPVPMGPVAGAKAFFAMTAPAAVGESLAAWLESQHGCEVVATSNHLSNRPALRADLERAPAFEVLLVELKAAAVDVAARIASAAGAQVVFCDNRPVVVGPDGRATEDGDASLAAAVDRIAGLADERFAPR